MLRYLVLALFLSAAFAEKSYDDSDYSESVWDSEDSPADKEESLHSAVAELRKHAHHDMQYHVARIAKHAELLQSSKGKAYKHNFKSSKAAIMAALRSLSGQLTTGHRHDVKTLKQEKARGRGVIATAKNKGAAKCTHFRQKACPTKRLMDEAHGKKKQAKRAKDDIENGNVCNIRTTLGDMNIDKSRPKLGRILRNKWDQVRSRWLKARAKYVAASKKYSVALNNYNKAMSAFTTSVKIEAANAYNACKNAHAEYKLLKKDVQSNVNMRKQVYISTLVVTCYVSNIESNRSARACAHKKRRSNTSQWNINGGNLAACVSPAALRNSFGPLNWKPSSKKCALKHWHEGAHKEKIKKEKAKKQELVNKERSRKEKARKKAAELSKKEKAAKKKERSDKKKEKAAKAARREKAAKAAEKKAKADERRSKELKTKEKSAKERNNKAKTRERNTKKSFKCTVTSSNSNRAGVIRAATHRGYVSVGGGINNHYRSFNKLSAFEEAMPEGNHYRCDTGFGPGRLTCYNIQCKAGGTGLSCGIWSRRKTGSGATHVTVPAGYTMTGGGMYNHYRSFNVRSAFEESFPVGNGWRGDMGFGWGDYTVYVRGCKGPSGTSLQCTTASSGRANSKVVRCPSGYQVTGCGIYNHYRHFNAKAGFEQTNPGGNACHCDSGFGYGDMQCYARCCKLN